MTRYSSAAIRTLLVLASIVAALSVSLSAQWPRHPASNIPKGPDGKPNLTAPAPRTADGKPDLSGIWMTRADSEPNGHHPPASAGERRQRRGDSGRSAVPAMGRGAPETGRRERLNDPDGLVPPVQGPPNTTSIRSR
jgi:hypothetical protein